MRYLIPLLLLLSGCYAPYGNPYYGYGGYPYPVAAPGYQPGYNPYGVPPAYAGQQPYYGGGQQPYAYAAPYGGAVANSPSNCGTPDEPKPCPPLPRRPLPYYPANRQ